MKIAFIDHIGVSGGIIRFGINLAESLCNLYPNITLTYFTHTTNYINNKALFDSKQSKFQTQVLQYTKAAVKQSNLHYIRRLINKLRKNNSIESSKKEIYNLTYNYDIVFFTTPHATHFIPVKPKSFGTFHDFNWMYLFGTPLFDKQSSDFYYTEISKWLNATNVIVSTPFVKNEINKFFPDYTKKIDIVFLAALAQKANKGNKALLTKLGIDKPYILYPGHFMPHKNHTALVYAFYKLMKEEENKDKYLLVFTGAGSNHFEYAQATALGMQRSTSHNFNIRGLGYLTNEEVDVVISNATLTVSTSLYEAGSGPAIDAWINEVPCIISNIPSHLDQLNFFSIQCHTFNPLDTNDVFNKLTYALRHIDELKAQSKQAAHQLETYNWQQVAQQYYKIFTQ